MVAKRPYLSGKLIVYRKWRFLKTLFEPEEFESADFAILVRTGTEFLESDDVTIIMKLTLQGAPEIFCRW